MLTLFIIPIIVVILISVARQRFNQTSPYRNRKASFIGFLVVSILGTLFFQIDFLNILVVSIVCTLGLGLLVWVPLWYLAGAGCLFILDTFTHQNKDIKAPQFNPSQQSLINYINQARQQGLSNSIIIDNLKSKGWAQEDIDSCLEHTKL